jgi:hypothetical protein
MSRAGLVEAEHLVSDTKAYFGKDLGLGLGLAGRASGVGLG